LCLARGKVRGWRGLSPPPSVPMRTSADTHVEAAARVPEGDATPAGDGEEGPGARLPGERLHLPVERVPQHHRIPAKGGGARQRNARHGDGGGAFLNDPPPPATGPGSLPPPGVPSTRHTRQESRAAAFVG